MALLDQLHDLGRKTARSFCPRQYGLIFAQQMLIELRLQAFPASLRLRAHRAIRRPKAKDNARHRRVEQRYPEAVFLTAQFFGEIPDFARIRTLRDSNCRRLLSDSHIRFHSPHMRHASTFDKAWLLRMEAIARGFAGKRIRNFISARP